MSISHTNKHIILQSHKHIASTRSFNRDIRCFLLILKLGHIFFNGQIYCMYSLYPFLHFFLRSFLIFAIFSLLLFIYICVHLFCPFLGNIPYYETLLFYRRRKWQPLPGESHGQKSLVGCCPWGCRVGHGWSDLAAAAAAVPIYWFYNFFLTKWCQ